MNRNTRNRAIKDFIFIILGVLSAGFGLKGFLMAEGFLDGGVTGISLLVSAVSEYPVFLLVPIINIPFLIMGYRHIGQSFAIKSIVAVFALALALAFIEYPVVTRDNLLISAFGGFFLGLGTGMTVRGGAVIDGTEVFAIIISKKSSLSIGDVVLILNIIIFSFAAYLISVEIALYAILTYLVASKILDYIVDGVDEYTGVNIISDYSDEIRNMITKKIGSGVTVYKAKRGFTEEGIQGNRVDVLFTVLTRFEATRLTREIEEIDPNAFVTMYSINEARGGVVRRRKI